MESSVAEDDDYIEVEFINDQAVVCVIKDEAPRNKPSNKLTETQKRNKRTPQISSASIKRKNTRQSSCDNSDDEEHVENDLAIILKPKVLFEDGDVPGDRMFSFHSTQKKTATNKLSSQKTPTSKNKIVKSHQEKSKDQEMFNVDSQGSDDSSENESKTQNRKSIRTRRSTKNELLDNDSKSLTDTKFGYETPKKSKSSTNSSKVKMTASSTNINLTPKTPRSKKYLNTEHTLTKTPKAVRKQIAKGIARQTCELLDELNDSDYSISDESDESDSDSSSHSNVKVVEPQVNNTNNVSLRRSTRKKEVPFVYRSEEYFLSKSAKSLKKSKTSDNTLKLLKNPALDKEQVNKLSEISNTVHDKKFKSMYKEIVSNFPYWLCLLREGFNLLLYGLGSKRQVINDFRTAMLQDESVLVINGFFPGLTLKEILESLTIDLLALDNCSGTAELVIQQIEETQKLKNAEHIYILVHNLDGVELQNYKTQHVLSRISSLPNVHLIASIDRVNAALMWDNTKLGDYNFLWMDCTNYSPYSVETDFVQSLMVKNIGTQHSLSGLNNVFKSLTANAKRILLLLIKNRIDNKNDKKYGVPFSILYRWCRQRFLVSTDLALRSQLTEFVDHELVKWKRDADVLHVCVDIDVLAQFYKLNEEDDE